MAGSVSRRVTPIQNKKDAKSFVGATQIKIKAIVHLVFSVLDNNNDYVKLCKNSDEFPIVIVIHVKVPPILWKREPSSQTAKSFDKGKNKYATID